MRLLYETGYFNAKDIRKLDQLYIRNESLSTLYSLYCILIYIQSASCRCDSFSPFLRAATFLPHRLFEPS